MRTDLIGMQVTCWAVFFSSSFSGSPGYIAVVCHVQGKRLEQDSKSSPSLPAAGYHIGLEGSLKTMASPPPSFCRGRLSIMKWRRKGPGIWLQERLDYPAATA